MPVGESDRIDAGTLRGDLARVTLAVLFLAGLIVGSIWVLSPFVAAFIWTTMIVVATWPIMIRVQHAWAANIQQQQLAVHGSQAVLVRVQTEPLIQRINVRLALGGSFDAPPPTTARSGP